MSKNNYHVQKLIDTVMEQNLHLKCVKGDVSLLIQGLVERVLNAVVGGQVKLFRSKKLSRVNDVNFRQNLKIKCEEAYI